jgi:hypothetical protein
MKVVTLWARTIRFRRLEVVSAVLTMMRDGQDLHEKLSALSYGTANGIAENSVQAIEIENAAPADRQMHPQNTARSNAIRCLIYDLQDVANEFALLHVTPSVAREVPYHRPRTVVGAGRKWAW